MIGKKFHSRNVPDFNYKTQRIRIKFSVSSKENVLSSLLLIYIYIYIYILRERERERERERGGSKSKWTDNIYFEITYTIILTYTIITLTIRFHCEQSYKSTKILSTQALKLLSITNYTALESNINDKPLSTYFRSTLYIYIYIYIYMFVYIYICLLIYIYLFLIETDCRRTI